MVLMPADLSRLSPQQIALASSTSSLERCERNEQSEQSPAEGLCSFARRPSEERCRHLCSFARFARSQAGESEADLCSFARRSWAEPEGMAGSPC